MRKTQLTEEIFNMRFDDISDDFDGHFDLRLGKPSPHAATRKEVKMVTELYASRFQGFNVKHFYMQ